VRVRLCKLQKWCTRLAGANEIVYQLLAHGRWFSPGTPASSSTKIGHHDITEILLKVALNAKNLACGIFLVEAHPEQAFIIVCLYMYGRWRSNYKERKDGSH
jgi:hypothetical protein